MKVKEYVDDYIKYYPEKWSWVLKCNNNFCQNELYLKTRARRCKRYDGTNYDLLPDFSSIERDAAQFGLNHVEWTDFFGLVWEGKKGVSALAGAPDYNNQPSEDIYTKVECRGICRYIDTASVVDIRYKYIVDNHLFKDTYIELIYDDGEVIRVWSDYQELITGLLKCGKEELVKIVLESMNEHFLKLRDSDREEIREFYPGKTAEEMFLI